MKTAARVQRLDQNRGSPVREATRARRRLTIPSDMLRALDGANSGPVCYEVCSSFQGSPAPVIVSSGGFALTRVARSFERPAPV
jgi:hypothetical protein